MMGGPAQLLPVAPMGPVDARRLANIGRCLRGDNR